MGDDILKDHSETEVHGWSQASYAIEPQKKELTVYHKNAFRLENAKPPLAKPFKVRIRPWIVRDQAVLAPATIDPKKDLS